MYRINKYLSHFFSKAQRKIPEGQRKKESILIWLQYLWKIPGAANWKMCLVAGGKGEPPFSLDLWGRRSGSCKLGTILFPNLEYLLWGWSRDTDLLYTGRKTEGGNAHCGAHHLQSRTNSLLLQSKTEERQN
jgi:hypothetical protein